MSNERRQILNMLAEGKITAEEAEELLEALTGNTKEVARVESDSKSKSKPKYLRVMVEPKNGRSGDRVNIRIPLLLVRSGMKLASIMPGSVRDKVNDKFKDQGYDIDLNNLDSNALNDIVTCLSDMSIDVDDDKESVKIFCE
jgi:hypothetical protein